MTTKRANVVGTGLIGGSVAFALKRAGWHVSGTDIDSDVIDEAKRIGAIDEIGFEPDADLTVIAATVGHIPQLVEDALERASGPITDVGSTKLDICKAVSHPRFVGGHPMAGSELDGLVGARAEMFDGAMWVLTPTPDTDEAAFAVVRSAVRAMGAETIALDPRTHDQMVAQVSHVPHLTAATLMNLADNSAVEHRALLRLAAGGFRDMTRISAGRPSIWPEICAANRTAIAAGLERLTEALADMREKVLADDAQGILEVLEKAQAARINLPTGFGLSEELVEMKIPIPDEPGQIAAIATMAAELDVNIFDLELTHSGEGRRGVMIMVVDAHMSERFVGGLMARGYRPRTRSLG